MSFGGSNRNSCDSLGEGVEQLKRQQCKVELDSADKAALQSELQELMARRAQICTESNTTPGKLVKKFRPNPDDLANTKKPLLFDSQGEGNDYESPPLAGCSTGSAPESSDRVKLLELENKSLKEANTALEEEVNSLSMELHNMRISQDADDVKLQDTPHELSEEAARKRLERICKRNTQGLLQVPEAIHDAWKKGGESRASLLKMLVEANFNKDEFVKIVTLREERKEQVQMKCWAGWASEDKMRDQLKIKEPRIKAIIAYCTPREGFMKTDKYDGKPIYWVEEEVEVEWQKTTSRTQAESSEYQVAASLSDVMADANEPLGLDMKAVASGMPGSQGGNPNPEKPQTPSVATIFPPVLKDEKPSVHILRYMDGITKRIQKLSDLKAKYEAIPEGERNVAHSGFIGKLDVKIKEFDPVFNQLNDEYSTGAVEGYADSNEGKIRELYKKATKMAQEALTLESRSKSIPLPKSKVTPKGKAKGVPKPKAAPPAPEEEPARAPRKVQTRKNK